MATRPAQGGASALPIAEDFIAIGGRLFVDPKGSLATGGSFDWLATADRREARRSFQACRRFLRRLKDPRFARSVKCLVVQQGERVGGGWLMMKEGTQS